MKDYIRLQPLLNIVLSTLLTFGFALLPSALMAQEVTTSEYELFQEGLRLYEEGLYRQSAERFGNFIQYSEGGTLARTAHYYKVKSKAHTDSSRSAYYYKEFARHHPHSPYTVKLLTELGHRAYEKEEFNTAIDHYQRALHHKASAPQQDKLYYWMAEAAAQMEDKSRARQYFLTLADTMPQSEWAPKALYSRGRLYLQENEYEASTKAFEVLSSRYPNNEMTRRIETALGESYYQQGKYEEAIEALKKAMPYLGEELKSKAAYLIAESYNYLDQFDQASSYYLRYINWNKGTPRERIAHYGLGWVYYKQEIYHWAAEQFAQAATGQDTLARKALYYKGVMNKLGGRYREALETFELFGERYKSGIWIEHAYYEWAITAYEMGRYGVSIEVLLRIVRGKRDLDRPAEVYTLLGESYFANNEFSRAIEAFEQAEKMVNIDPEVKRQARFQKAWVQFRNQAYQSAGQLFEQVRKEAPDGSDLGAEALFWEADAHYNMNEFQTAARLFDDFVRRNPQHEMAGPAFYALGWSYFELGSYDRSVAPFKTFLNEYEPPSRALFPYNTDTRLRLGDAHYATGAFEEAINFYEQAIGAEPGGDYAMYQIANSHYRDGNTYEAVTTFRKLLRIYPYTQLREQAQYNIAYVYFLNNNYEQAIEEFRTVIEKYPNTTWAARAQYSIGDAYYNATEYKDAIEAYRKVMENYSESEYLIDAVNGIQYAQMAMGSEDTSDEILEEFLNQHPKSGMADRLRYRQAENLMQAGSYKKAIASFKQYLRITNSEQLMPAAHYNMGESYEQLDRLEEAIEEYTIVAENYSQSEEAASALSALGRIAYSNEQYQASARYYERLRDKGGSYRVEAYVGIGNAELSQGQFQQALDQFNRAMEVDSTSVSARMGVAKVAMQQGNLEEAVKRFSRISKESTTIVGAEAQYLLGRTYQRRGSCEQAIEEYSRVSVLYSAFDKWVSRAMLGKARCQVSLGRSGDARSTLRSILDDYPDTEAAREANQLLNDQ